MWFLAKPSEGIIQRFLAAQGQLAHPYAEVGLSENGTPTGYNLDHNKIALGKGAAVFEAACAAIKKWKMFPRPWTEVFPSDTPIQTDSVVAVLARAFGLWWLNACRIVYVIDETAPVRRFGFAYGTLPGHVECGEERFTVVWDHDDVVYYDIRAFSRPRHWMVRLAKPLTRRLQKRFVRDSQAAMRKAADEG